MFNIVIILSILFSSSSQILLKKGVMQLDLKTPNNFSEFVSLALTVGTNLHIIMGVLFQIIALGIWLYVLRKVDVSYAYPFIALGFIFVMGLSYYFFDERLSLIKVLGGLIICLGIFVLSLSRDGGY
jgi:multidrug transporter EmrE-like cation transporter